MAEIIDLAWRRNGYEVSWHYRGQTIKKTFNAALFSAVILQDHSGVALVLSYLDAPDANAFIFNANGEERCKVAHPDTNRSKGYEQIYYVNDELTGFAAVSVTDYAYVINPDNGEIIRKYETR